MEIYKFLQKYKDTRNIERRPGCGRPTKMTPAVKALMEVQMRENDETTAIQLHALLLRNGHTMTLKTVLRYRADLSSIVYLTVELFLNRPSISSVSSKRYVFPYIGKDRSVLYCFS